MTSTSVSAAGPRPPIALGVNGRAVTLAVAGDAPLLQVLRNDLGLNSPKYGCGLGECGACTVLIDGVAARACVVPLAGTAGREVTTLEGLGTGANLHPVQQAFIAAQAAQCGYCLAGMIMGTVALLAREPRPSEARVRDALSHNLCRCGAHLEILQAVQRAVELMASAQCPSPQPSPADAGEGARAPSPRSRGEGWGEGPAQAS